MGVVYGSSVWRTVVDGHGVELRVYSSTEEAPNDADLLRVADALTGTTGGPVVGTDGKRLTIAIGGHALPRRIGEALRKAVESKTVTPVTPESAEMLLG